MGPRVSESLRVKHVIFTPSGRPSYVMKSPTLSVKISLFSFVRIAVSKLPGSFHSRVIVAFVLIQLVFQYSIFIADQSD